MVDIILRLMRRVELLLKLSLFFPQKLFFFNHIIILWLTKKWYRKRFILNYSKLEKIKIITNFTNLNIFLQFQGKLAQRVFPPKLSWFTSISIKRNKKTIRTHVRVLWAEAAFPAIRINDARDSMISYVHRTDWKCQSHESVCMLC